MSNVKVRFAPSPTGNLHIGSVRTALFNWLYARSVKGSYLLRIEDTDMARSKKEYEINILEGLSWLGLDMDEGPDMGKEGYRQTERIAAGIYEPFIERLIASGDAYYCFCTSEELEKDRTTNDNKGYSGKCRSLSDDQKKEFEQEGRTPVVRFRMKPDVLVVEDLIRGKVEFDCSLIPDFVIKKTDGAPAYNFAVVVDDYTMGISHVVRGEDHLNNTPKQVQIYEALGVDVPLFAHMPMILGSDKSKLSKRHGATSVVEYQKQGFLSEAIVNYLSLLGWSHPEGKEIMSLSEIIENFSMDRMSKSGAVFDVEKLKWMNGQYIRSYSLDKLYEISLPFIKNSFPGYNLSESVVKQCLGLVQAKLGVLADVSSQMAVFFDKEASYDETLLQKFIYTDLSQNILKHFLEFTESSDDFSSQKINEKINELPTIFACGKGKVFKPLRYGITGYEHGPDLAPMISLLGKEKVIANLKKIIKFN